MAAKTRGVQVSAFFCVCVALMLLVLPLGWLASILLAAAFHECCHFLAIRFFDKKAAAFYIGFPGASIELPEMGRGVELLCAIAGPLGSFSLLLLVRWFPRLAFCGLMQGLYNLLPISTLDGGRVINCFLSILFPPPKAKVFAKIIEMLCKICLLVVGMYATFILRLGLFPFLAVLYSIVGVALRKK